MFFELFLSLRYLKAKRKEAFISLITIISILGVMVGVMALIVVLSVMNGFRADLMSKILGVNSHILVFSHSGAVSDYWAVNKKIKGLDCVVSSSPFIEGQVMLENDGNTSGAILKGIDPESIRSVMGIESMVKSGSLASLQSASEDLPSIIIGRELARQIGAFPGKTLKVVSPEGKLTPLGRMPNTRKYKITALFDSGMFEYDATRAFIHLSQAQDFLNMGNIATGFKVRVDNLYHSDKIAESVQNKLGDRFWTRDWKVENKSLFSAIRLEKIAMFVILTMIVLVGALNIVATLVMGVMEKNRDIAILRAMGASSKNIMVIFMLQGVLIGLVGTLAGLASGYGICYLLGKYQFINLPADVYYISKLPVLVQFSDVWIVVFAAIIISFITTLYPSWHASRVNPVEVLRYE